MQKKTLRTIAISLFVLIIFYQLLSGQTTIAKELQYLILAVIIIPIAAFLLTWKDKLKKNEMSN